MAARSRTRGSSSSFAWSTIFYIALVLFAPLLLSQTARAEEQVPLNDTKITGPGKQLQTGVSPCKANICAQKLLELIWEPRILALV